MTEINYWYEVKQEENGDHIAYMKANSDTIHVSPGFASEDMATKYAEGYYKGFAEGMLHSANVACKGR